MPKSRDQAERFISCPFITFPGIVFDQRDIFPEHTSNLGRSAIGRDCIHEFLGKCQTHSRVHHGQALIGESLGLTFGQDASDRFALPPECQCIVMAQSFDCPKIRKFPQRISRLNGFSQIEVLTTRRNCQQLARIPHQVEDFNVILEFLPAQADVLYRRKDPAGFFQLHREILRQPGDVAGSESA